ncbi:MAG TPA: ATP-binding protein [Myxococcota bacterium]|nr:ATP-binding protein [Myxococcota bacterium]
MTRRRLDLLGTAAGLVLGATDTLLLAWSGVEMTFAGRDASLLVGATFTSSLAIFGFLAGRLALARARVRADAETIRAQGEALAASQRVAFENEKLAAIGRLAAGIAHEVRNPLGVVRASASLVQEHFHDGDDAHRACRFIVEETDRLDGLIASLLAFARPNALALRAVPVAQLVSRAEGLAREALATRGAALVRRDGGALDETVTADSELLAQLVLGLVTNAAEAVAPGGTIELRARCDDGRVAIAVADDGPGVPPADRERVFEPFFTTKERGTGLGLAMADRIARAHGGTLRVVPGAGAGPGGRGACFELSLPRGASHPALGAGAQAAAA